MIKPNKTLLMTVTEVMDNKKEDIPPILKKLNKDDWYTYLVIMLGNKIYIYKLDGSKLVYNGQFIGKDNNNYKDNSLLVCYSLDVDPAGGIFKIYRGGHAKITRYGSGLPIIDEVKGFLTIV